MTKTDRQKETKKHKQTNNMTLDMFEKKLSKEKKEVGTSLNFQSKYGNMTFSFSSLFYNFLA